MNTPMAATGFSVIVKDDKVEGGVYPDFLEALQMGGGCSFLMRAVPRARLENLFESGGADLLIPATRNSERDLSGTFVPLIFNRATLISLKSKRRAITSAQELIDRPDIKVVLVRGFGYGNAYDHLIHELEGRGRLQYEVDPLSVARLLKAGVAQATIMAPSILAGSIQGNELVGDLFGLACNCPTPQPRGQAIFMDP